MTLQELSAKLRQVRSEMPPSTSEEAYAQMERLKKLQMSPTAPKKSGQPSSSGPKSSGI